jgi:hypothetical protein
MRIRGVAGAHAPRVRAPILRKPIHVAGTVVVYPSTRSDAFCAWEMRVPDSERPSNAAA